MFSCDLTDSPSLSPVREWVHVGLLWHHQDPAQSLAYQKDIFVELPAEFQGRTELYMVRESKLAGLALPPPSPPFFF